MPMKIEWHVPYKVIDVRCWDIVTKEDVHYQAQNFVTMLAEGEVRTPGMLLYLLYDATEARSMPPLYMMLKEALPVLRFKNRGPMFLITRNKAIRSIFELSAHVTRFKLYSFATREEALEALERVMIEDDLRDAN